MLKNILKYIAGCCLTGVILLGTQGASTEAAEYTTQEINVIESQEWKQYVEAPEEYTFESAQTLNNGLVMVRYEKEDDPNSEVMPLSQTVTRTALVNFYDLNNTQNTLLMTFLETSTWAYGGATGDKPYFGAASYGVRYTASGVTSWTTPKRINTIISSGYAAYDLQVTITYNGNQQTCYDHVAFNFY